MDNQLDLLRVYLKGGALFHRSSDGTERRLILASELEQIEQEIGALIDAAKFDEITTKEFDALKRCHYIVLKRMRALGLLAF